MFVGRRKLVQTPWDLLFLDLCHLVPPQLSAVGVVNGDGQSKSPRNLQRPSAVFTSVQQLWGDGWRGGCSSTYIFKAGGHFKMYVSILIAVF